MLGIRHCVSGVLISLAPTPGSDIVFYRMRAEMKISLAEFFFVFTMITCHYIQVKIILLVKF